MGSRLLVGYFWVCRETGPRDWPRWPCCCWPRRAVSAAITVVDTSSGTTGNNTTGSSSNQTDYPISGSLPFTVSSGADAIVVQYSEFAQNNTGLDANPIIEWNGVPLTKGIVQLSVNSSYVYADIFYLMNPTAGAGSLTVSGSGRTYTLGAFTLSGVNTAIAPTCVGQDSTSEFVSSVTLSSTTAAGSFAAVAEGFRTATYYRGPSTNFTLTASTSGPAVQLWTQLDPGDYTEAGGGYVANLSAGATTITASNSNALNNRNEVAAAVFLPISNSPSSSSAFAWTGGAGSGGTALWNTTAGNWSNSSGTATYSDNMPLAFSSTGINTNITIASTVNPGSLTFSNGTTPYSFSGASISGTASVTLGSSAGSVTLSNSNGYTGGTTVSGGTLVANNNTALGSGAVSVNAPGMLDFTSASPSITSLSGSGSIVLGTPSQSTNLIITGSATALAAPYRRTRAPAA